MTRSFTKQEIIVDTLLFYGEDPEGRRSVSLNGYQCLYNGPDGKCCALSRCIEPDRRGELDEDCNADQLVGIGIPFLPQYAGHDECGERDEDFWMGVQTLHDESANWTDSCFSQQGLRRAWAMMKESQGHDPNNLTAAEVIIETALFYAEDPPGRRSLSTAPGEGCRYRGPEGRQCAVGRVVDPDCYLVEGDSASLALGRTCDDDILPQYRHVHRTKGGEFWESLQDLHDAGWNWDTEGLTEEGLKAVYNLLNEYANPNPDGDTDE